MLILIAEMKLIGAVLIKSNNLNQEVRLKETFSLTYLSLFQLGKSQAGIGMGIKINSPLDTIRRRAE